jgi:hypothetical protein
MLVNREDFVWELNLICRPKGRMQILNVFKNRMLKRMLGREEVREKRIK